MKKKLKIAIDSPAASGAGTQSKMISNYYNLFHLDTGKLYRYIAKIYINNNSKINYSLFKNKIHKMKLKELNDENLLLNKYSVAASILAKDKKIRKIVYRTQKVLAYNPPKKFKGSCLDGRDITYNIIPDADVKLYLTASLKIRSIRRYKELRKFNNKLKFIEVYNAIKLRDYNDKNRKIAPLKKTKDAIVINTSKLTKNECFKKIKKIIDIKLKKF